jgi:hypothetical protein
VPSQRLVISAPIYAVVQFDGEQRRVSEVVVAFENVPAADRFAAASGFVDYTVAPIEFHIGNHPETKNATDEP